MKSIMNWSFAAAISLSMLSGCGGGSGETTGGSTSFSFVTPTLGSQQIYSRTLTDNSNNTIIQIVRDTVITVRPDGSYDFIQDDPTHNVVILNRTAYSIGTETVSISNVGDTVSYSYTPTGSSSPLICTYSTTGIPGSYPRSIGQSWNFTYAITCPPNLLSTYVETGVVSTEENLTVQAGTFTALKTSTNVSSTNSAGTTTNQAVTTWKDIAKSTLIKQIINYTYSGTVPPNSYPISITQELQNTSP